MSKKIIYSLRVFLALTERGFEPIATTKNPAHEDFMCWIYDYTPELEAAL